MGCGRRDPLHMRSLTVAPMPHMPDGLLVPDVARAQAGVFTRSQARRAGWSDTKQRRMIGSGLWVGLCGSAVRHRDGPEGPWPNAWAVALTGGLIPSHGTAGQVWGLRAPDGLNGTRGSPARASGVVVHRARLGSHDVVALGGLRLTSPLRTVSDLLRCLDQRQAIELATDAMRKGQLDPEDLDEAADAARLRTGASRARFVARTCAGRPFSPLEWRFHRLIRRLGPGWVFNVRIEAASGAGVVDALHLPTGTVVELDGRAYHEGDRFQADRARDRGLVAEGYVVLRFTWEDIDLRPEEVVDTILRVLARRTAA